MSDPERERERDADADSAYTHANESANVDRASGLDRADRNDATRTDADDGQYARFKRYVDYAVLAGLLLLAFVAVVQFYFATSSAIGTWVAPEYRAPFRAVFNLVVVLFAGLGVSLQLRRLGGGATGDGERVRES